MINFYVIKELATGIIMIESTDLEEIKEIFENDFDEKYFILEDNYGKEVL